MNDYIFEVTDPDHWKHEKGYLKDNGYELDVDRLQTDLLNKISSTELVVSGNILVDFGSVDHNLNISLLLATKKFELAQIVVHPNGNADLGKRLAGDVVAGVKVRSTKGPLPYRWRI